MMRSIKKLLALALAAALVTGTMSMAVAAEDSSTSVGTSSVDVSSVTVTPETATVKQGELQQFAATVMLGVSDVTGETEVNWSVKASKPENAVLDPNTVVNPNGLLVVAEKEKATELIVTAEAGGKQDTATVTVTAKEKPVHVHTKGCLSVYLNYDNYNNDADGRGEYLSMDTSEANPKSDYLRISVSCNNANGELTPGTKAALEVTGDFKDTLSVSVPAVQNHNADYTRSITYAARLSLKEGKQVQGALTVPLTLTVDGVKIDLEAALYAEKADPMYTNGTAVFTVDLKDLQKKYTSTPVKLNIPGGVRTIAGIEVVDHSGMPHKYITAKLTDDSVVLEINQYGNVSKNLFLDDRDALLKVTFKARTSPLIVTIPMETNIVNELVTLEYTKELRIPDNSSTTVTAKLNSDFAEEYKLDNMYINFRRTNGGQFAINSSANVSTISAKSVGTAEFDANISISGIVGEDKVNVSLRYVIKNNKISAAGKSDAMAYASWQDETGGEIDLNILSTYNKELLVRSDSKDVTVTKVELAEDLSASYDNDQPGKAADFFNFSAKPATADGKMPVTLTLKNNKDVKLTTSRILPVLNVTLSNGKTATILAYLEVSANAPKLTAHDYKTGKAITTDSMTVGESKKYIIKSNNAENYKRTRIYSDDDFMTVVRGKAFYSDFGASEVVTLRLDKAYSKDDYLSLSSTIYYTPKITNKEVLVTVSGDDWGQYGGDLVVFSGGSDPTDPEDPDPEDPDPEDPSNPGNPGGGDSDSGSGSGGSSGSGSNNTANTPATSDKVQQTVDAVKGLKNITADKLPAGVTLNTTAGGASIATIPVKLTTGSASLGTDLFNTLGAGSSRVGLELTVSSGTATGSSSVKIIIPGGFGKITEPGRISFPMDFKEKCDDSVKMLSAVKGANAVSTAMQIGGSFTLPTAVTITVKSAAPEGSTVNIYKYDPLTGKYTVIGKAKVVKGQLTFATKIMGQMLFTTGTI